MSKYYFQNYGIPVVIGRPFNLFGAGSSCKLAAGRFNKIVADANDGDIVKVGNIESKRDYVNIKDAVAYYWGLLEKGVPGEIYNVCTGVSKSGREFLLGIISDAGKNLSIATDPDLLKEREIPEIFGCTEKISKIK